MSIEPGTGRPIVIRPARPEDLEYLPEIERAAGAAFRELDMAAVADDVLPTVAELAEFQRAGRAWVAVDDTDRPVAYVLVEVLDGGAHVEQVSVHPGSARRRLGKRLLDTVASWARRSGLGFMTLTTFAEVPWNASYYERIGWSRLDPSELTPGVARHRAQEAARGLDQWPRVAMRYELT